MFYSSPTETTRLLDIFGPMCIFARWSELYLLRHELANHTPQSKTGLPLVFVSKVLLEIGQTSFFFFNISCMAAFVLQQQSWVVVIYHMVHKVETLQQVWPFTESVFQLLL